MSGSTPVHELVDGWLAEIGATVDTSLALSADGVCVLAFDDGIEVTVEVQGDGDLVHLHSPVGAVPAGSAREALLERALALNLFNQGTEGATLGYDQETNALVLYRCWPLDQLDSECMADAIAGQVVAVGEVRARLAEAVPAAEARDGGGGRGRHDGEHPPDPSIFGIRG